MIPVFHGFHDFLERLIHAFVAKSFQPPRWCPSGWAPALRLHTKLYKEGGVRGGPKTAKPHRNKGQVALEGNFRFVLDKSDLKSSSDKKFVRKATVALKNKICEQNTTPCFSALSSVN